MYSLKKVFSILFASLFMLSAMLPGQGISELNRLSSLIKHYQHHKIDEHEPQLSFADFLVMHYDDHSSHRNEENHDDLPLYHHCCNCQFFITEKIAVIHFDTQHNPITYSLHLQNHYEYNNCNSIFQPPKFS